MQTTQITLNSGGVGGVGRKLAEGSEDFRRLSFENQTWPKLSKAELWDRRCENPKLGLAGSFGSQLWPALMGSKAGLQS